MSRPTANTSLSLSARLALCLGLPSTVLLVSIASPKACLLTPLAFLPAAGLYKGYSKAISEDSSRRANLEPLIWTCLLSATAGSGITIAIQVLAGFSALIAHFAVTEGDARVLFTPEAMQATLDGVRASFNGVSPEDLTQGAALAFSWQSTIFHAIFSFITAITEETLTYLPVAYSRRSSTKVDFEVRQKSTASLDYALAWGLGLGLFEASSSIYIAVADPQSTWPKIALTIFDRVILDAIVRLLMAALTALRSIRLDQENEDTKTGRSFLTVLSIIGPSILLRGANNFVFFSFSAWSGNLTQKVAMFAMYSVTIGTTAWLARRESKAMEVNEAQTKFS